VTAAAVIHQPSCEIFEMFDDLLLLGKGGRTVYYGPQAEVQVMLNCGVVGMLCYAMLCSLHLCLFFPRTKLHLVQAVSTAR
jgi:hypothetical protein